MTFEVKGKTYKNYRQAALKLGLNYSTVWLAFKEQLNRIAKGGYLGRNTPFAVKRKDKDEQDG